MTSKIKIFAGNWKMNHDQKETLSFFHGLNLKKIDPETDRHRHVIFPVAYNLNNFTKEAAESCGIELGAQNVHWETKGAFTGELSAKALREMGFHWTLIAHSERRQLFGETNETAGKRFQTAAKIGLNVIFCIGETLEQRESNQMEDVLTEQLGPFIQTMKSLAPNQGDRVWSIAYEPVWAIGTGKTATNEQAEAAHQFIRNQLTEFLGGDIAQEIPILYGGSVKPENASGLLGQKNIDGVLVGGASLKPDSFSRILESC